ncbi:MAG: CopG family ribbon-helix-helix protein [Alphaproteobacteria bacterium]|nr:CopG family ribbon-helix-helix protein [Alphaproteobacteria bacterium]
MAKDVVLSARIPEEMKEGLSELAAATDRPIGWHVTQALSNYVELNRWQVAAIRKGLEQVKAGKGIPLQEVEQWVASWGTGRERQRPKARKLG